MQATPTAHCRALGSSQTSPVLTDSLVGGVADSCNRFRHAGPSLLTHIAGHANGASLGAPVITDSLVGGVADSSDPRWGESGGGGTAQNGRTGAGFQDIDLGGLGEVNVSLICTASCVEGNPQTLQFETVRQQLRHQWRCQLPGYRPRRPGQGQSEHLVQGSAPFPYACDMKRCISGHAEAISL